MLVTDSFALALTCQEANMWLSLECNENDQAMQLCTPFALCKWQFQQLCCVCHCQNWLLSSLVILLLSASFMLNCIFEISSFSLLVNTCCLWHVSQLHQIFRSDRAWAHMHTLAIKQRMQKEKKEKHKKSMNKRCLHSSHFCHFVHIWARFKPEPQMFLTSSWNTIESNNLAKICWRITTVFHACWTSISQHVLRDDWHARCKTIKQNNETSQRCLTHFDEQALVMVGNNANEREEKRNVIEHSKLCCSNPLKENQNEGEKGWWHTKCGLNGKRLRHKSADNTISLNQLSLLFFALAWITKAQIWLFENCKVMQNEASTKHHHRAFSHCFLKWSLQCSNWFLFFTMTCILKKIENMCRNCRKNWWGMPCLLRCPLGMKPQQLVETTEWKTSWEASRSNIWELFG